MSSSIGNDSIDFMIIGAQKSASTSVQIALDSHPDVYMPRGETPIFERRSYDRSSADRIVASLRARAGLRKLGIKRPDYLADPASPRYAFEHCPDSRLVVILRDPADRALAAYYHYVRFRMIEPRPHEEGIAQLVADFESSGDVPQDSRRFEILRYGNYGSALREWCKYYNRSALLIVTQEQLSQDWQESLSRIAQHLGVEPIEWRRPSSMEGVYNLRRLSLRYHLWPVLYRKDDRGQIEERSSLLTRAYGAFDRKLLARVLPSTKPELSRTLRAQLQSFYASELEIVQSEFDVDVSMWRAEP